ncbi:PQQ-dependent sugar dehydrogenase [Massilia sp. TWR1-2-2]|uniref:PQQ-dependent sugar dehydrogenase n=1 Tax=Massilia sp. TWR1-2-2 TaxID=2804584 RepID=UPI003CEB3D6C
MLVDRARNLLLAAVAALLLSCGGGGSPGVTGPDAPPLPAPPPFTLALRQVASGLDNPTFVAAPRGDPRLFIVERAGRIRMVQDGLLRAIAFLDISARVSTVGEGGLLSIALHPHYAVNGQYFLYFTDAAGDIVVERRSVSANANLSDPTSALEIIRIPHPNFRNHYGGLVAFGADGFLYLATGDGGGGDPARNAQDLANLLGKMLRLDIRAATAGAPYALPPSNRFIGQAGRRGEIWACGLRNPWRYGFDGGQLYIADVGQDHREEVNIVAANQGGQNYGWNVFEGTLCYNAVTCGGTGLTAPFFEYDHGPADANGCSIAGGEVYRGAALPSWPGAICIPTTAPAS